MTLTARTTLTPATLTPATLIPATQIPAVLTPATQIHWETALFADLLVEACPTSDRMSARAAYQWALHRRAVLVDIRSQAQRRAGGVIHPDLAPVVIDPVVLQRRLDPHSAARLAWVTPAVRVIVLCQEGRASSLAAASLNRLGLRRATDVVGGMTAWREAGLPLAATG